MWFYIWLVTYLVAGVALWFAIESVERNVHKNRGTGVPGLVLSMLFWFPLMFFGILQAVVRGLEESKGKE